MTRSTPASRAAAPRRSVTGPAWTAATLTLDSDMAGPPVGANRGPLGRGLADDGLQVVHAQNGGGVVGDVEPLDQLEHVGPEGGGLVGAEGGQGLDDGTVEGGEELHLVLWGGEPPAEAAPGRGD